MTCRILWLSAACFGAMASAASPLLAQPAEGPAGERQQSVQSARYGAPLGLPRDGDKLYLSDDAYPRFPLPPGNEAYAHVDGLKMKEVVEQITAISRKSRDDGNQYWGRIAGTRYDRMTQDWVADEFRKIGLQDVRRQELDMRPLWYPDSWKAEFTVAGATTALTTTFPINGTVGTPAGGIKAQAVWVGLGTAADLTGRDIKDKAVFIYSVPTPGGRDHSAAWNGAVRRVNEAGAALVFVIMGFPGNAVSNPEGADGTRAPTFTISPDEGNAVRAALENGQDVTVRLEADIKHKEGLKTGNVWGVLPGTTDESIVVMAHTDSFFEGAMDNASGVAMMLEIARHYAAIPQAQRRRTITFLTTPDHHHGSVGIRWVRDHFDFSKTALIVNCEHPSQTLLYLLNAGIMTSNAISARRWYVGGSDALKTLVSGTFREFGVSVYAVPERRPGGELSQLYEKAPSFHIIDHVIYHTTLDTSKLVPAWGMEAATRAFLKIIDGANTMSAAQLKGGSM
jgi:Peptidase family M28